MMSELVIDGKTVVTGTVDECMSAYRALKGTATLRAAVLRNGSLVMEWFLSSTTGKWYNASGYYPCGCEY